MWILSYHWSFELYSGYFFRPWRLLTIVYTSPGVIAAIWLLMFRESPRFLLMKNEKDKAIDVLQWVNKLNNRQASSLAIKDLTSEVSVNNVRPGVNTKDP
jgi:Sugar (and other) transporter